MEGWIKVHRQICENEFWLSERFTKAQAWIDLLLLASHKPNTFFIRGNEVNLERGQLGYSIKGLSERWKWNERTVDKFLKMLSNREMIQCRKTFITTTITIKNYDIYQSSTEQTTAQSKSRIHTNKNVKNEENISTIFSYWNSKKIIIHREIKTDLESKIKTALEIYKVDEIKTAIDNYHFILCGNEFYFSYKWTLKDFLQRGLEKFLDKETAIQNYQKNGTQKTSLSSTLPQFNFNFKGQNNEQTANQN